MPSRRICIAAVFVLAAVNACGGEHEDGADPGPDSTHVTVEQFEYVRMEDGNRLLTGVLYNPTASEVDHAQIQVSLYDAANQRVDSMIIPVRDISAGERKKFSQAVDSPHDVRGARPRSVLVW